MSRQGSFLASLVLVGVLAGCVSMESDWAVASGQDSVAGYKAFLNKHSTSAYAQQARERIEELTWALAEKRNTAAEYKDYLKKYPSGRFASEATRRHEDLLWTAVKQGNPTESLSASRTYLSAYPNGRFASEAKEKLAASALPKAPKPPESASRPAQPPNSTIFVAKSASATADMIEADVALDAARFDRSTNDLTAIGSRKLERIKLVLNSKTKVCINGKQVSNALSFPQGSLMTLVVDSSRDLTLPLLEVHSGPPEQFIELAGLGLSQTRTAPPECDSTSFRKRK